MTCPATIVDNFCAVKDPVEVLDYGIDYSEIFDQTDPPDEILTSAWALTGCGAGNELILGVDNNDGIIASIGVSGGGVLNSYHNLTNTITTVSGRTYVRTISIWIQDK